MSKNSNDLNNYYPRLLVDTGVLVAFYNVKDRYHDQVVQFFANCRSQLITTIACVVEVMWLLRPQIKIQNEFLLAMAKGGFICEHLTLLDYQRIRELNTIYKDLPGDFADLALIAISERLNIRVIASLDKDFDIYRRYQKDPFDRVFRPN